ncbi:LLM class oxidoreductase [Haloarcula litorea]|uniref:LLM class oxidoreductase n=1 Tax=Haloarcula litorea TaxID=3032579 RepID=UPI0023E7B7E0|nr:LLM class oxidoreductase [Halomicroarcula sp. GDY20]
MTTGSHENVGYRRLFGDEGLTYGVGFPLTGERESTPAVDRELRLAERAESLGFDGLWARDVPTYWPRFGDAGGAFDTWPLLSHVAAHTERIALGTASVVLPLRHPIHVAKSAATVDRLSGGRLVVGVASGDRDPEYPAFDVARDERGQLVRERIAALRTLWREEYPSIEGEWGELDGDLDVLPKPTTETLPLLPTGNARQSVDWIAEHGDGWLFYHLPEETLQSYVETWREETDGHKPFVMALRLSLADDPTADPEPIHQGYHAGSEWVADYVRRLDEYGVDHLLLGFDAADPGAAMTAFATDVLE